jgi:hypothetical protein
MESRICESVSYRLLGNSIPQGCYEALASKQPIALQISFHLQVGLREMGNFIHVEPKVVLNNPEASNRWTRGELI